MEIVKKRTNHNLRIRVPKEIGDILRILINNNPNVVEVSQDKRHYFRLKNVGIYRVQSHKDGSMSLFANAEDGFAPKTHHPLKKRIKAKCKV